MLKPNGEAYLTFCSKESTEFTADLNDLKELLANFNIELIKLTEYCNPNRTVSRRGFIMSRRA